MEMVTHAEHANYTGKRAHNEFRGGFVARTKPEKYSTSTVLLQ